MRIMDYPKATEIVKGQTFLNVDSAQAGTKAIEADDLRKQLMKFVSAEEYYDFLDHINIPIILRRNIGRGKNLGSEVTDEQKAHIADGTFRGIFIGDYWEQGGFTWRVADIDYWYGTADPMNATHHVVIVPDQRLGNSVYTYNFNMNTADTVVGAYANSEMKTKWLPQITNIIRDFAHGNLLTYRNLFANATSQDGYAAAGSWYVTDVDLMNEPMVFGSYILMHGVTTTEIPYRFTIDKTQLSLFKLFPEFINRQRISYWLRDVISKNSFSTITSTGYASYSGSSATLGVRPVFGITG